MRHYPEDVKKTYCRLVKYLVPVIAVMGLAALWIQVDLNLQLSTGGTPEREPFAQKIQAHWLQYYYLIGGLYPIPISLLRKKLSCGVFEKMSRRLLAIQKLQASNLFESKYLTRHSLAHFEIPHGD